MAILPLYAKRRPFCEKRPTRNVDPVRSRNVYPSSTHQNLSVANLSERKNTMRTKKKLAILLLLLSQVIDGQMTDGDARKIRSLLGLLCQINGVKCHTDLQRQDEYFGDKIVHVKEHTAEIDASITPMGRPEAKSRNIPIFVSSDDLELLQLIPPAKGELSLENIGRKREPLGSTVEVSVCFCVYFPSGFSDLTSMTAMNISILYCRY